MKDSEEVLRHESFSTADMRIRRIEFNWHYTTSEGERIMNYDLETNADEIKEGKDGFYWIKTKEGEIHKITNINAVYYENKDERLPELE